MTTTTTVATAADTILAIDLGKYKSVACLYRSADDQRFATLPTTRLPVIRARMTRTPSSPAA
jgi:hypothetical protein